MASRSCGDLLLAFGSAVGQPSGFGTKGISVVRIAISGTGLYVPPETISNAELVEAYNEYVRHYNAQHAGEIASGSLHPLLKSSDEFIVKASGIRRRHVVAREGMLDPDIMCPRMPERGSEVTSLSAEIALAAARQALEAAHRTPADIDGIIVAASILQRPYPQIAIEVQETLGIAGFGFDMLAGCSSATFGIQTAAGLICQGQAKAVLCINPEICSSHLNLRDRETHFIFGDAATACIVERAQHADGENAWEIVGTRLKSVYSNNIRNNFGPMNRFSPETMGAPDKLITQKGRKVFKEVVPMVAGFMLEHLGQLGIAPSELKRLWLHQANINMNDLIARKVLGRDPRPDEAPNVLEEYGNTSSAGSIIAFHQHNSDLKAGDLGHLCSFGAGYTAGSVVLRKLN
jgi:beta-ketodecanoyl-[acyl-carrier-protein] synthase